MLSREERILSELLVARGLVSGDELGRCHEEGPAAGALADELVAGGVITPEQADEASEEAREIAQALKPNVPEGRRLGDFTLVRQLGRGGMGVVFEAEQEGLARRVALKVLPAGAALDERLSVRFLREGRALARLDHPNLVRVHASGRTDGVLFLAMELVDGPSLDEEIARGRLEPTRAARIAADTARGLAHAHAAGLIHRDVKPANVLLGADGRARLTDFGLVQESRAGTLTLSHHVLGTPAFMPPEQARGETADERSDVYGVGALLHAMLSGKPPHEGDVPSLVLARVLAEDPPDLAKVHPELPPQLVATCRRAMARRREDRHASAKDFAEELERFSRGELRAPRAASRRWRAVGTACALAGVLVLAAALGRWPDGDPAGSQAARWRLAASGAGRKTTPALSPDGGRIAWASDVAGSWDVHVQAVGGDAAVNLTGGHAGADRAPSFSPDGALLAFAREGVGTLVLDPRTDAPARLVTPLAGVPAWSPDSSSLALTAELRGRARGGTARPLHVVDVDSGQVRRVTSRDAYAAAWAPKGGRLAFASASGGRTDLWTIPAAGGEIVRLTDDAAVESSPRWAPDAATLLFARQDGDLTSVVRLPVDASTGRASGEPVTVASWKGARGLTLDLSGDGRLLAVSPVGTLRGRGLRATEEQVWLLELTDEPGVGRLP